MQPNQQVTFLTDGGHDVGVALQHAGALVGRSARQEVWPAILRWADRH
jgi:hypothetical protein